MDVKKNSALSQYLHILGPGLTTGAADDDPSGIATYTQTGAQFGYGQLWTVPYLLPLMIAMQEACARIGAVTGKGIAATIKKQYNKNVLYVLVGLIVIANTMNIGADIGAMASATQLLFPINFTFLTCLFTVVILILEIFTSYRQYASFLKWLTLALFAYPLTLFIVTQPWREIFLATFIPHIEWSPSFFFIITGVLGTTISPYMFFWQASQEVEEERTKHLLKNGKPQITKKFLWNVEVDTIVGMFTSQFATWCIIIVAATVLFRNGIHDVQTAADGARALEPLVRSFPNSGLIAKGLFAVGVIGLGLLAVPVLSSSASYALSEALDWREGLNLKFKRAHGFYGVITISTIIGLGINFIGINPIKALIYTAVLNGIAAVPLIFVIARIAENKKIMGKYRSGMLSRVFVWLTFLAMLGTLAGLIVTFKP